MSKIPLGNEEFESLGKGVISQFVAGLRTPDPDVIAACLGTLMVMIGDNVRANFDGRLANVLFAEAYHQWCQKHGLPVLECDDE